MPKTDTLDALDDDAMTTILTTNPNILWTYSEHTLNTLWTHSEPTLNIPWTYPEDMPKIWQNLKNINQLISHSPTWIQEMLAHLKRLPRASLVLGLDSGYLSGVGQENILSFSTYTIIGELILLSKPWLPILKTNAHSITEDLVWHAAWEAAIQLWGERRK